ncbi:MAG TPA: alkaline phosphatase family protein [Thermoanaerobaculia bacterium]|nr:alkaline phosphatase family protein [Thermoanaerobaculia bacterium]
MAQTLLPVLLIAQTLSAQPGASAPQPDSPSLVVVISVDQLRWDYLERFSPWFSAGGFNRFLKSGAAFPNTHYIHAVTFTGPGHATIGSGKNPSEHGIIANLWLDRSTSMDANRWKWYLDDVTGYEPPAKPQPDPQRPMWFQAAQGSPQYCVYDDTVKPSEGKTTGMSPRQLIGEGLGDRVKAKYPGARVIGIALKDRAAILMAGRNADAVYWFDQKLPGFISSSYYHYDPKLFAFNSGVPGYIPGSHAWNPSPFIPPDDLKRVTFDPPEAWPLKNNRYGGTFPHPINDFRALSYSPFGSDVALDFALWTIAGESLGTHPTPDVLFVSLSSTDYFGHYYGPDSMEVADGVVRLDRSLERFFDVLDRRFGDRVLVALTADHGVQPTPEILKLRDPKADAGRIDLRNPSQKGQRLSDLPPQRLEIEKQLAKTLHVPFSADAPYSHALVFFFEEPALYLNQERVRELKLDPERVKHALRDVVLKIPGVAGAWTDAEIRAGRAPHGVQVSYLQGRSGDVLATLRTNWIWSWGSNSTTHGQPVENDQHVPLLFWGAGMKAGRYEVAASPADLARTIAALLGVNVGGADAHLLPCLEVVSLALNLLDPKGTMPRDSIRIDKVEIDGNRASVQLWTGKPPKPRPGVLSMDCGIGHIYVFEWRNGKWELVSHGVMQC